MESHAAVEVYRSPRLADCDERAFVLIAVGVPSAIGWDGAEYRVFVGNESAAAARVHLDRYAVESLPTPPPTPLPQPWPHAWVGPAIYALVLHAVAIAIALGIGPLDAFWRGDLDATRVRAGEWWRALTALTLHRDIAHFAGNLGAGVFFGWFAARRIGSGLAWALIVLAAGAANLLESLLAPDGYHSAGASTAVFAALGLLAAWEWSDRSAGARSREVRRRIARWAPLIAGVILLGFTGSGTGAPDDTTDLVAHVVGFALGALAGAIASRPRVRHALERVPQWVAGGLALAAIAIAWGFALAHSPPSASVTDQLDVAAAGEELPAPRAARAHGAFPVAGRGGELLIGEQRVHLEIEPQ